MTTTTSATGSNTFLGTMASMFTGATSDAASMFAGSVRTKLDLGLNKERPKLIDPEAAAHQISENFHRAQAAVINSANGLSENGVKLAGVTAAATWPATTRAATRGWRDSDGQQLRSVPSDGANRSLSPGLRPFHPQNSNVRAGILLPRVGRCRFGPRGLGREQRRGWGGAGGPGGRLVPAGSATERRASRRGPKTRALATDGRLGSFRTRHGTRAEEHDSRHVDHHLEDSFGH
jgi:hypothetical protein